MAKVQVEKIFKRIMDVYPYPIFPKKSILVMTGGYTGFFYQSYQANELSRFEGSALIS